MNTPGSTHSNPVNKRIASIKPSDLKQQFRQCGCKYTAQRQAVVEIFLEHQDLHMSSEEIHALLREKKRNIGVATVYRTLALLEKVQIIRKTDLEDGCTRYELCHQEKHAHHHLICIKCGVVSDMEEDMLERLEQQIYNQKNFRVENHSVKFYGYCKNCQ